MVFFKIVKLIDDSARQNGEHRAENNAVDLKIKYEFPEIFVLVKEEKR